MTDTLSLSHGLRFADLYEPAGLARLDAAFLAHLAAANPDLHGALVAARGNPEAVERKAESDLLIAVAPHAEDFIGTLFGITNELRTLAKRHTDLAPLFACKRLFVQRRATRAHKEDEAKNFDGAALAAALEKLFASSSLCARVARRCTKRRLQANSGARSVWRFASARSSVVIPNSVPMKSSACGATAINSSDSALRSTPSGLPRAATSAACRSAHAPAS